MKKIYMKAPAKINFGLWVLNKRNDNYHNIYTLFYPLNELFDEIIFELATQNEYITNDNNLPLDDNNLIIKAKKLLEEYSGKQLPLKINCNKKIPYGAGLGGGSSDAASTLVCINELYKLNIKYDNMLELALQLGSDVPFFIKAKPAIGELRGEKLTQVDFYIKEYILLVNPGINISTGMAYSNLVPAETNFSYNHFIKSESWLNDAKTFVKNDFENYVFEQYPEIKNIKDTMYHNDAIFSLMSGSGSSVYGFFKTEAEAKLCATQLPGSYLKMIITPNEY